MAFGTFTTAVRVAGLGLILAAGPLAAQSQSKEPFTQARFEALQAEGVHPDIVLTGGEDGLSTTREASLPHALPSFGRGIARDQVQVAAAACPAINRDDNNDRELGCALSLLQSGSLDRFLATRHADAGR